jgi:NADH-quinone oxidoreductase subunit L
MWFLENAWLIPLIPAVSFVVILFFGKRMPKGGSELGILAVGSSFALACGTAYQWIMHVRDLHGGEESIVHAFGRGLFMSEGGGEAGELAGGAITRSSEWFQFGGLKLHAGIQIDGLAVMMMFVVTLISLLVHIYSTEYMRGDRRYTYFFAALSLFTASMLLLVVADNTLLMLVGWELVGLCSFMLIGHWWEDKANSAAAIKAFLTTRTGDIGLLTGVVMTFFIVQRVTGEGSFNILEVNASAKELGGGTLVTMTAFALLLAIMGKSGQFPLHTWLPDAMAGPTPVSALIHAATMVVAGVYLGARLFPVFYYGFDIGGGGINPMAAVGGITILVGASLAFVQDDIKKVLAYSTISQLGYMVMALGVGAWTAAVFHLFTHAFFKADLFLGAGSVSHSGSHHSFDMKKDMGGLRKYMPQTHLTFVIATIALAGIFPFAGFWSKDEILVVSGHEDYQWFLIVGLIGAFMTAAYMTRCVYLTFYGEYRGGHAHAHAAHDDEAEHIPENIDPHDAHAGPHESNRLITIPLWILTAFACVAGFLNFPKKLWFEHWVAPKTPAFEEEILHVISFNPILAAVSVAVAVTAFLITWGFYTGRLKGFVNLTQRNGAARAGKTVLVNKYYLDHLYEDVIVANTRGSIANAIYWVNQKVIDNVLNYTGKGAAALGRFTYNILDQKGVDGFVNGIGAVTTEAGGGAQKIQTGRLQLYALVLVGAVAAFALVLWLST